MVSDCTDARVENDTSCARHKQYTHGLYICSLHCTTCLTTSAMCARLNMLWEAALNRRWLLGVEYLYTPRSYSTRSGLIALILTWLGTVWVKHELPPKNTPSGLSMGFICGIEIQSLIHKIVRVGSNLWSSDAATKYYIWLKFFNILCKATRLCVPNMLWH